MFLVNLHGGCFLERVNFNYFDNQFFFFSIVWRWCSAFYCGPYRESGQSGVNKLLALFGDNKSDSQAARSAATFGASVPDDGVVRQGILNMKTVVIDGKVRSTSPFSPLSSLIFYLFLKSVFNKFSSSIFDLFLLQRAGDRSWKTCYAVLRSNLLYFLLKEGKRDGAQVSWASVIFSFLIHPPFYWLNCFVYSPEK